MPLSIPIILGTTRKNNQSKKVAEYLLSQLKKQEEVSPVLLDLGSAHFPIMEERLGQMENPPKLLLEWNDLLLRSQAIIIVAPEYKNGYPGSLKNFLDFLPAGVFRYKPIGIATVSSGQYGGTNCLAQLRLVSLSLAGVPIPDRLQISEVQKAFDESGEFKNEKTKATVDKFISELMKYADSLKKLIT